MNWASPRADVIEVLARVGSDPAEDTVLRQSAGESLGELARMNVVAAGLLDQLLPDARAEALAVLDRSN